MPYLNEPFSEQVFALLLGNDTYTGPDMMVSLKFTATVSACVMITAPSGELMPLHPSITANSAAGSAAKVTLEVPVGKSTPGVARAFGGPLDPYAVSVSYVSCQ